MRAAARTFPVRAAASSSTSSFAPPPTSSSAQTASELGAGTDFVMALTLTLTLSLTLALAQAQAQATLALLWSSFSRRISAVARGIKPVSVVAVGSRPTTRGACNSRPTAPTNDQQGLRSQRMPQQRRITAHLHHNPGLDTRRRAPLWWAEHGALCGLAGLSAATPGHIPTRQQKQGTSTQQSHIR